MATANQQKHLFLRFSYKCGNPLLDELMKIKVMFILTQGIFRLKNLKKSVTFLTHLRVFPPPAKCHVKQKHSYREVQIQ